MPLPWVDLGHAGPMYPPANRWPLDEAAGNFRDIGGGFAAGGLVTGMANGTILRNPTTPPGWATGCVQMSTGGWINIWNARTPAMLTQYAFSVSAWIRRVGEITAANGFQVICAGGDWAWNLMVGHHASIPYSGGNLISFGYTNVNGNWENCIDNGGPMPLNTWYFVMGTWDGYRLGLERNGYDVSSNSGIPLPKAPTSAAIGCYPDGSSYRATSLQIADVRIYPYRLFESEARAIYQSYSTPPARPWIPAREPGGLYLHVPMDQGGGRNVRDGNGNMVGGNTVGTSGPYPNEPKPGMAYFAFNGSNEYWAVKSSYDLTNQVPTNRWTLAGWAMPTAASSTFRGIITRNHTQGGNNLPSLGYGASANDPIAAPNRWCAGLWDGNGWLGVADVADAPLNQWAHVAVTYDGATMRLYRNGVSVASATGAKTPGVTANDWLIGKRWDGTGYFPGRLSDIRVYGQALSPEEIKGIYDRASGVQRPWMPLGVVT